MSTEEAQVSTPDQLLALPLTKIVVDATAVIHVELVLNPIYQAVSTRVIMALENFQM